ncbi:MAG: substrate-binding domain-containing protein [Actinobacteria bacterium]|nr:substrate-binding domain-containing protein [Actinomycetota bacterium]MCG2802236.1 substrate-binding domain-containing protein [Cellulomonas sp.]
MATMQDVANLAQVSLSTVSYTLTGKRPVSAATRVKVEQAMAELGFRRHAAARALAARRTHVLALAYPTYGVALGATLNEIVQGAVEAAREAGYELVLWPVASTEPEVLHELAAQRTADGVLVMEVALDDPRIEAVESAGVPCAMIGRTQDPGDRVWVDIDFEDALTQSVRHLTSLGHRQIAFINRAQADLDAHYGPAVRADEAYIAAMHERGLTPLAVTCDVTPPAGRRLAGQLLAEHPGLTAFIVMNELALFGVASALREAGRQVPQDFSILAVAIAEGISDMYDRPLSYLAAPGPDQGRLAVRGLLDLLDDRTTHGGANLRCVLHPRSTTGPAPAS